MGFLVLLLLIGLPLAEIWVMIEVGQEIGAFPTVAAIVGTAALGVLLFRIQGMATLARAQEHIARGEAPVGVLLSGLGLLVAGLLLLIPGFLTDAIGLLLFIPPVRRLVVGAVLAWVLTRGSGRIWTSGPGTRPGAGPRAGGPVIEGDFADVTGDDRSTPAAADDRRRLDDGKR